MENFVISTDLSVAGFDNMLKELQKVKTKLPAVNKEFLEESLRYLQTKAQYYLNQSTGKFSTGKLASDESFHPTVDGNIGTLRSSALSADGVDYAIFVEMGTGIVGAKTPHELAAALGWVYDKNSHGVEGWYYVDDAGDRHWTAGMEAHRYMYNALIDYQFNGGKEECIKKAFGELG